MTHRPTRAYTCKNQGRKSAYLKAKVEQTDRRTDRRMLPIALPPRLKASVNISLQYVTEHHPLDFIIALISISSFQTHLGSHPAAVFIGPTRQLRCCQSS